MTEEQRSKKKAAYMKAYYQKNKDKWKKYRANIDKEAKKAYNKQYYIDNRERLLKKQNEYNARKRADRSGDDQ